MAHVVPKLFKAILVFSDRATIYSDVISLPADQLKTQLRRQAQRAAGSVAHKRFPSKPTPGNLWIVNLKYVKHLHHSSTDKFWTSFFAVLLFTVLKRGTAAAWRHTIAVRDAG